jgi:pimeloyl-ACP methyl ester carboxylesterase
MKRKVAGALAVVGGGIGLTVANRLLAARADETLAAPLPGESKTYRWRGLDVAYTEAGDPEDPDLLLVHGLNAAGTSREFEPIVEALAEEYHVLAPDLPGFGRSERAPLVYSASLYEAFVADFAREFTEDAVCVAASLSAAYALDAAEDGVDFSRLVLIAPTATTMPGQRVWLRTLLRSPVLGTALYNLIASRPSIDYFADDHGYYDPSRKPEGLAEYQWQSAHQPGARYAPASFVSGYLDSEIDMAAVIRDLDVPTTLVWGREAEITPLADGRDLADASGARLVVVDYATLQPHGEHPEQFLEILAGETGVELPGAGAGEDRTVTIEVEGTDAHDGAVPVDTTESETDGEDTESDAAD